ncbi:XdhC family protein [Emcibacter sp.]|uniref:XdhC family protein n=1 Tax=Emcibacter sp. TaxID=1979954 RepID=UPI003A8C9968
MTADWQPIWKKLEQWQGEGRTLALATVVETWGSSPRPVGSHMIVDSDMRIEGSVSGGCIESSVIQAVMEVFREGRPRLLEFTVTTEMAWEAGLSCGGHMKVLVEPFGAKEQLFPQLTGKLKQGVCWLVTDCESGDFWFSQGETSVGSDAVRAAVEDSLPNLYKSRLQEINGRCYFLQRYDDPIHLVVLGAVHVAQALLPMAEQLNIRTTLIDPRTAFATEERFPGVEICHDWPDEALDKMEVGPGTAIVTLTHDAKLDDPALDFALKSNAFYIGALGSRKTNALRHKRLLDVGFTEDDLKRIHGPVGLDIGSVTPQEIALSILAEVVAVYRGRED